MRGREQLFVMCEQAGRGAVEFDGSAYQRTAVLDALHDVAGYAERGERVENHDASMETGAKEDEKSERGPSNVATLHSPDET